MAYTALTDKQLLETLRFFKAANGNVSQAARLACLPRPTYHVRLDVARQRMGPEKAVSVKVDKSIAQRQQESEELRQLRAENEILRQHLAGKTAAKRFKPVMVKKRSGKDDLVRVVIPDTHGSHIDPAAWAACIADIQQLAPHEIVHLGDYMDCGGFLSAKHVIGYVAQLDEVNYEDDLEAWRIQLDQLQAAAPSARLHLLEGNHLSRIERWAIEAILGHGKNADFLRRAICPEFRLDYKARGIRYAKDGDLHDGLPARGIIRLGSCYFTHGFATGRNSPQSHADRVGGPVVYGHVHTPAAYYTKSVSHCERAAWTPGCLCKFAPRYMHSRPDTWGHGYAIQFVARSGLFTHVQIPLLGGVSLLPSVLRGGTHRAAQGSRKKA